MQFARSVSACSAVEGAFETMQHKFTSTEDPLVAFAVAALGFAFLAMLDTDQLLFMAVGAAGYLFFHTLQKKSERKPRKPKAFHFSQDPAGDSSRRPATKARKLPPTASTRRTALEAPLFAFERDEPSGPPQEAKASAGFERRSTGDPSALASSRAAPQATPAQAAKAEDVVQPRAASSITAPTFLASGFDAEVPELLAQICPTAADDAAIDRIVRYVSQAISPIFPEAEVLGFASARLTGSGAFGVAVPEVDLVIDVNPVALLRRLQRTAGDASVDEHKLQKHVLRKSAGRLVERAGFKFRRSAFGGPDPKVTLLLPSSAGLLGESTPLDLAVNSAGPLRASALLTECGAIDPRAKELILLVRRWAKDRGVSHAARGHLPTYAWNVLVVYFLQVGVASGSILPPFHRFKAGGAANIPKRRGSLAGSDETVSQLFVEFFRFYAVKLDLQREAVSACDATRGPQGGQKTDLPVIEDPFEPGQNLAEGIQRGAFERMLEELARAHAMCSAKCSLTALLQPWLPPEALVGGARPAREGGDGHIVASSMVSDVLAASM